MKVPKLITVSVPDFEATLPWLFSISPFRLVETMAEDNPARIFRQYTTYLRELIDPKLLPELDQLEMIELMEVVEQWANKSMALYEEYKAGKNGR